MGAMKQEYGDMQEAYPLTEAEEMEMIRQQMILEQQIFEEHGI